MQRLIAVVDMEAFQGDALSGTTLILDAVGEQPKV